MSIQAVHQENSDGQLSYHRHRAPRKDGQMLTRLSLLAWLIRREKEEDSLSGALLLQEIATDPLTADESDVSAAVVRQINTLHQDGLVEIESSSALDRAGPIASAYALRTTDDIRVTSAGYALDSNRETKAAPGPVFNISNSTIGQLAGNDIVNDITLEGILDQLATAVDRFDASAESREEAHRILDDVRSVAVGASTTAAGGLLNSALRALLNIG